MPRYKMVNGERIQFTAAEETARDAEEQAWADGALGRAQADLRAKRKPLFGVSNYTKRTQKKRPGKHAKRPNKHKKRTMKKYRGQGR